MIFTSSGHFYANNFVRTLSAHVGRVLTTIATICTLNVTRCVLGARFRLTPQHSVHVFSPRALHRPAISSVSDQICVICEWLQTPIVATEQRPTLKSAWFHHYQHTFCQFETEHYLAPPPCWWRQCFTSICLLFGRKRDAHLSIQATRLPSAHLG